MSFQQNAGKNYNLKFVAASEYLTTTVKNRNYIHEDFKNRSDAGNACLLPFQNLLP
jgi:hypothetical protein